MCYAYTDKLQMKYHSLKNYAANVPGYGYLFIPAHGSIYEKGSCNEYKNKSDQNHRSFKHDSYNLLAVIYFYSSLLIIMLKYFLAQDYRFANILVTLIFN